MRLVLFIAAGLVASLSPCCAALAEPTSSPLVTAPPAAAPIHELTLDKVKAQGFLKCGGVLRPGLAMTDGKGHWSGLEVEVCRAVATTVFGDAARYTFHDYSSARDFDAVRSSEDQLAFLTFAEMADQKLTNHVVPGPAVFIESLDMLVPAAASATRFGDMSGKGICFMIGTASENELEAWFHDQKLEFIPFAFQEEGEKFDAYNVQKCAAIVDEATALGNARRDRGVNKMESRFVDGHLLSYPVLATTPLTEDAPWAAIVAWTVSTLINQDARASDYHASGLKAMEVPGAGLGLPPGWQKAVIDRVGSYSDIFRRTLGAGSPLKMDQDLNRRAADGGLLVAPFRN